MFLMRHVTSIRTIGLGLPAPLSGPLELGVTVCEDAWQIAGETPSEYDADPIEQLAEWGRQGVNLDATVNLSASPYHSNKIQTPSSCCPNQLKPSGTPSFSQIK